MKSFLGYSLAATDGEIGKVKAFYFDDSEWVVRYLVVQTGRWLGREVLIAPGVAGSPDTARGELPVRLTREAVRTSPDVATDKPVSRQIEEELALHYGVPVWYALPGTPVAVPSVEATPLLDSELDRPNANADPHLRSSDVVVGYHIQALDGEIGHVHDFVFDDESWSVRYLVVDTRNWLPGRKVLILPAQIKRIDWDDSKVYVNLTRERVEQSPEFDPAEPVNRKYEEVLLDFYGRPAYWRR